MGKPRANQKRKFSWHKHWPIFGSYEISLLFFLFHLWMYVNVKVMVWCDMMWCFVFHVFFTCFVCFTCCACCAFRRTSSWAVVSSRCAAASVWSPATRTATACAAEALRGGRATRWSTWPWSCRKAVARWPTAPWAFAVRASCSCRHPKPGEICGFKVIIGRETNGKERNHNFYMRTQQTK